MSVVSLDFNLALLRVSSPFYSFLDFSSTVSSSKNIQLMYTFILRVHATLFLTTFIYIKNIYTRLTN